MKYIYKKIPTWSRILALICALLLLSCSILPLVTSCDDQRVVTTEETEATMADTIPEETYVSVELPIFPEFADVVELSTVNDVVSEITIYMDYMNECNSILTELTEDHPQYQQLVDDMDAAERIYLEYGSVLETHWNNCAKYKPNMTYVWGFLKDAGFNDYVAAGIIGNMIAETGGSGGGDLRPNAWDSSTGNSFYGLCQWSSYYYPEVSNTSMDFQLQFLLDTYERELNNYGGNYSSRYGSEFRAAQFVSMTDAYEAAIAFAKCYERCASQHVEFRGSLAENALTFFTTFGSWPWPSSNPYATE